MKPTPEQRFTHHDEVDWESAGDGIRRKVMAYGEDGMAVLVEFERGAVGALHHHPHLQISFVHSGTFEAQIDGITRRLTAGDFFYVPSGAEHGVTALTSGVLVDFFHPMRNDFV